MFFVHLLSTYAHRDTFHDMDDHTIESYIDISIRLIGVTIHMKSIPVLMLCDFNGAMCLSTQASSK